MARSLNEDPLTLACLPPPNESEPERRAREAAEAEARRVSDEIDEALRKERLERRRKKKPVKVLLLGQSESGTSAPTVPAATRSPAAGKTATLKSTPLAAPPRSA